MARVTGMRPTVALILVAALQAPPAHAAKPTPTATIAVAPQAAATNAFDPGAPVTEITVDRVRPVHEKHPMLRFLRENRDFLRARLDLLRATRSEHPGTPDALDPRWLSYQAILSGAGAGSDSVGAAEDRAARRTLLEHIGQLSDLESELDRMDRVLDAQAGRLQALDADFAGHQQTALVILLKGHPAALAPAGLTIAFEDSTVLHVTLTQEQREALLGGGIAELWHGFVEPRQQVVALSVERGGAPENGWMTLTPARDQLTFLRLDLGGLGAGGLKAGSWVLAANTSLSAR